MILTCTVYFKVSRDESLVLQDYSSTIHLRAAEEKQRGFCRYIFTNKVAPWAASYSACLVYTKTIIHLHFGE